MMRYLAVVVCFLPGALPAVRPPADVPGQTTHICTAVDCGSLPSGALPFIEAPDIFDNNDEVFPPAETVSETILYYDTFLPGSPVISSSPPAKGLYVCLIRGPSVSEIA